MTTLWSMRARQVGVVARLEARRSFGSRQAFGLYGLAFLPATLPPLWAVFPDAPKFEIAAIPGAFAHYFEGTFLSIILYFSCASVFSDLFRREVTEKSLHYWLLSPIRRELLALGKFAGAMLCLASVFSLSVVACFASYYVPHGWALASRHLPGGLAQLGAYLLVTLLAVLAYGSLFFVLGLWFRSPIVPALVIWLWESINHVLPSFLKVLSVVHYLKGLLPVRLDQGLFALSAAPPRAWISVVGLLVFTLACLGASMLKVRRLQVSYAME